ncbi:MAG: discoidin domain-containing protein [Clostridia bacterium]|nr:discoidin domain-containing protein [Clostridia bacterium]
MKRVFSVILSLVFLLTFMANLSFAEEVENEITNIAPNGTAYCTSEKNSLWTPVDSVINGKYGGDDGEWQGWECAYPEVSPGQDTSMGFSGDYFGINFKKQCYDIYEIKMNIGLHTLAGGQNATYTIQALVDGLWQDVVVLKDDQAVPTSEKYADYNSVMNDPEASTRVNATLHYVLDAPVTTNNIRITVSDYAKNYVGGDVLIFPFVYELELFGIKGYTPEIILPEGASFTTDVAWYSYPSADRSSNGTYPFLAVDGNDDTYWEAQDFEGGKYFTLMFDKEYDIGSVNMILGTQSDKKLQPTVLEYYFDGTWQRVPGSATLKEAKSGCYGLEYVFEAVTAKGIRIKFRSATDSLKVYTIEAHLDGYKTYNFDHRFDKNQLNSASNGNIAIIGTPYASSDFTPYSDVKYINDGVKNDKLWFTGKIDVPEYCGITFNYPQKISKAVITVKSMYVYGIEAMRFEIQALIGEEYVKIAEGKSYNEKTGYTTEYTFDEIETTDIRVVITEMGGAIPNVAELELFNKESNALPMFSGMEKAAVENAPIINDTGNEHICIKEPNVLVPTLISVGVVAAIAIAVSVLVITKKKNKEV